MELKTLAAVSELPNTTYVVKVIQLMIFCEANSIAMLTARRNCVFLTFEISSLHRKT